ncbi:VirE N-terminal domain-containing protein, partial [Prevotellaceae bacterium MN60]
TGLVVMDVDHVKNPHEVHGEWLKVHGDLKKLGILLVYITPSGEGLKIVFKARQEWGNLIDNQHEMAKMLGVEVDESCKDASRMSFICKEKDILYIDKELFTYENKEFGERYDAVYRDGHSQGVKEGVRSEGVRREEGKEPLCFKSIAYKDIIAEYWRRTGGEPQEGERNVKLHKLAVNLRAICDNKREVLMQVMPRYGLTDAELLSIVESACKEPTKGSKMMEQIVASFNLSKEEESGAANNGQCSMVNVQSQLDSWGTQIESLFPDYPMLKDVCKGLKKNQYPAALIVAGAFGMTLMTRCYYRFYHRPEELRRLNSSALIIGDPASGKSFATRLFKLMAAPIIKADKVGKDAINAYREQMRTKGANKEKPKKPKVVVRVHPARTSNAQFIQDMVNAVETVDGEEMHLHMLTFDTELDNTVTVQKGGSWIDKMSLELKAFHNEEDGQAYSNNESILQDFNVYWNYVYTGTPIALKKKVNEQNFGSGLATRLTVIPLPPTNFEMMSRESTVDTESDERLKQWAEKLDRMKGELSVQKIVDELYDWTARRMADAAENDSKADEMLLKRCAYHGLNYAAPYIVMRHWAEMHQEGDYWCGEFETDETDWRLAELIVNMQYACQRHYFGAMAEAYFDNKLKDANINVQRRQKTIEGFQRLPEEFTSEDVMRCFGSPSNNAAQVKIGRLIKDHLIEKCGEYVDNRTKKAIYKKIAHMF